MIERVVVTNAFFKQDNDNILHPALQTYEKELLNRKQVWSVSGVVTPLSWVAQQADVGTATLLASQVKGLPEGTQQLWVASPYHARLTRAELRVMPENMLDWSVQDAINMCDLLNPMLIDEGLKLHHVDGAMLLSCDRVWDVQPVSFAAIAGSFLPNRQPQGADAGTWMRLLSEIQMTLHQQPLRSVLGVEYHGLWVWGGSILPHRLKSECVPHVATHNFYLKSILNKMNKLQDATMIVSEAEQLSLLLNPNVTLPKSWLLMGAGKSVELKTSVISSCLAKVRPQNWKGT